jgi:glycerophosphoryl diester phosphodiesterase
LIENWSVFDRRQIIAIISIIIITAVVVMSLSLWTMIRGVRGGGGGGLVMGGGVRGMAVSGGGGGGGGGGKDATRYVPPNGGFIGHRGIALRPENTISSFICALENGHNWVECDIQVTKDNKLFIFHDDELDKKSNGSGLLWQKDSHYLSQLDCGSWFSSEYARERMPTLKETISVLDGIASKEKRVITINMELKVPTWTDPDSAKSKQEYDDYVDRLVTEFFVHIKDDWVVRNPRSLLRGSVSSFDWHVLNKFLRRMEKERIQLPPYLTIGYLSQVYHPSHFEKISKYCPFDGLSYNIDQTLVTSEMVTLAKQRQIRVFAWTVNSVDRARDLFAMGVDGVFSDVLNVKNTPNILHSKL